MLSVALTRNSDEAERWNNRSNWSMKKDEKMISELIQNEPAEKEIYVSAAYFHRLVTFFVSHVLAHVLVNVSSVR